MPLEETDTESEVEEQAAETLAPTAAAATSNVAPAPTPAPAEAPKEENSIKKRLQNTLATLQRELESDEQELTTSAGALSPPRSSSSNATGATVPRLPSSGDTAATQKQAEASTPPPLRRREANTPVAAGGRQVSTLTLRSSGSGSMKAQAEQEDKGSFNSALQRQADRMREQVESLQRYATRNHDPSRTHGVMLMFVCCVAFDEQPTQGGQEGAVQSRAEPGLPDPRKRSPAHPDGAAQAVPT